jgi:flotillin
MLGGITGLFGPALVLAGILAFCVIVVLVMFMGRFQRCPSNKILVIYGKTGRGVAKCVHGGAAFVWPVVQSYEWLHLEPFDIPLELSSALSHENIRVAVPTTVTAAISTEEGVMQNAAVRLLGRTREEIQRIAQDIILGQMRAVMATMRIEEINRDRQAFMAKVNQAVAGEIEKIGLAVINVNIKDVEDESGYIKALGKKAAAQAVNQALIDVAEQEKVGKIGVAERERDQRRLVAAANSEASVGEAEAERDRRGAVAAADATASIGEAEAERDRRKGVAVAESGASVGEAEAERDRRQQTAQLDAQAVETETEANAQKAGYNAAQVVAEEEARAKGQTAAAKADGSIRVAQELAQKSAEDARGQREQARLYAEIVVPAEASKQKAVVEAEAEGQKRALIAKGEAEGALARMQAEAQGVQAILDAKAAGYKSLVQACNSDGALTSGLLLIEKLGEVAKIQTDAIKNLAIERLVIWDQGGNGGMGNLGTRLMGVLPPMHELAKMAGLELPDYLGRAAGSQNKEAAPSAASDSTELEKQS